MCNLCGADAIGKRVDVGVVAELGEDVGRRDAVGHAVVDLHQDRPLIALQTFDDPAFPQRAVTVETALQRMGDGPEQLGFVAWSGKCDPPHVVGEVKARIFDPLRCTQVERACSQ